MAFPFPPQLRARLAAIRAEQAQHIAHLLPPDAVYVFGSLWVSYYLTSDGRVLIADDDQPATETADPLQSHATLIRAAECFQLPEFRTFLPLRPPTGIVCPACQGTAYLPIANARIFCHECAARGWVDGPA
ncbi:MAG TPA: hypothetical protein VGE07_12275 [Herpetosiphonaceae bacterium]